MNTRRKGIIILLASVFATICLSSDALATRPRASSQIAQPSPQDNALGIADFEAALEDYKETEQILQARIRDLEEAQRKLIEQIRNPPQTKTPPPLAPLAPFAPPVPPPEPESSTSFNWLLGGTTLFTFALCVILLLRMQRPRSYNEFRVEPVALEEFTSHSITPVSLAPATVIGAEPLQVHPLVPALPDWDSASPALDLQSLKALTAGKNVRNRDSTIELAEIMLSFGRINSAAEALTNFIEKNPKEAFAPWLKLLEVYRANGQRTEFDKIAQKLNKTFNVWTVDWDNFSDSLTPTHSLETMTHIMERLQKLWGTRKCQAYLQFLLRDTRDETRRGFPLAAIEDILCLNDVLEYYLGPYTGPASNFDEDELDSAPVTETENDETVSPAPNQVEPQTDKGEEEQP
ncbi:MAG: hypothetical protein FWD51_06255 [Betaproteobacteria bacterium]|nr:hypothetical protein [Betaproteobacteria bacterium]